METVLIYESDTELSAAWASYFSHDGIAVFTTTDSLEAAEIISMINIDSMIISSDNPATFLLLGRVLRSCKISPKIVAVSSLEISNLQLLLESDNFELLKKPFTFSTLKSLIRNFNTKTEVRQNVLV